ncbi:MAG: thiamine diphosphokinase [candidate division KSB1 bacterium]|nr:thiamine diphosphokinase [candidate division KSB1 bacterium]
MRALIFINGELPQRRRYEAWLQSAELILCADGGANRALAEGIMPHFVIGDFDSLMPETRARLRNDQLVHRPSQYAPDIEKTLQFAVERGVREACIVGATRGRFDHQICNLNIMEKFCSRLQIEFVDDTGQGTFVRDRLQFEAPIGQQVSLFAFRRAEGITTYGLKYPLDHANMEWAVNDGLSNEVIDSPVEITVKHGTLFVFRVWPDDPTRAD